VIQIIERPDDARLAAYQHVGHPEWLCANHLFVAEGRLVVQRVIELERFEIDSVLVSSAAFSTHRAQLERLKADVFVGSQATLDGVTGYKFHRGCLALVRRPDEPTLAAFAHARRLVALEGVGNPDNMGGVFRSAAAFSADGVLLDPTCGDPLYRKAVRTSMGAVLRVPFARVQPWPQRLDDLREAGFTLLALSPAGQQTIDQLASSRDAPDRFLILAGAEGSGLTRAALDACHMNVRIPIDSQCDSLNVVVALSVALHRLSRV
jgi:tRNA G18 (ribose-2'-O)-methylase SpoU